MILDFLERFAEAFSKPEILQSTEGKAVIAVGIGIFTVIGVAIVGGFYFIKTKIQTYIKKKRHLEFEKQIRGIK